LESKAKCEDESEDFGADTAFYIKDEQTIDEENSVLEDY
jgi:hypothetical protein